MCIVTAYVRINYEIHENLLFDVSEKSNLAKDPKSGKVARFIVDGWACN